MPASDRIVTITANPAIGRIFEVDDVVPGRHLRGRRIDMYPGGKGITVSRVLSQLGTPSIATGFVGSHEFRWFEKRLAGVGPGVITSQLLQTHTPTRDNIILLDPENHNATYVRDRGHPVTQSDLERLQAKVGMLARENRILFFGGTLPPDVPIDWYRHLVARSIEAGAKVAVTGPAELLADLRDLPLWLLRTNRSVACALVGDEVTDAATAAKAAKELVQSGISAAVVTVGEQGAALATEDQCWVGRCDIGPDRFVNKVGCGDCLTAGLLHHLLRESSWSRALEAGLSIAAANAMTASAGVLLPDALEQARGLTIVRSSDAVSV